MIRTILILALLTPLAACGEGAPEPTPAADPSPVGTEAASNPTGQPPYVGRWAANPALCANRAWEFRHDGLTAPGDVACRFEGVAALDKGYEIAALCTSQAPPESRRLNLSFGSTGWTMSVQGAPGGEAPTLVRCET
ncbi:hypothetical protein [Phenylobacterium sp.]|uniref:hypothetical protein n=1 Tax=Phenylobacterium sp. TaxID=1871053 RepID=UPI0027312EBE|nr:hypothetical protein [Phenylobacterium sp.]MDP1616361.1 hypothetical protein [Phenylobacterium sp.]MDP1988209.1 hypothetical protein [Phenylobacterium sp.]